ncbi:enoyl-CoA hydratase/isomerase family protein [Blastococcus sp. TF02A-26]|uniref:enoyl-CoA hydratase/isomerase family protein n=1 Tax=Blastococcus sp. TF02A-26 TaxID=2250577 RepID=UPI000DE878D0|nr:enoyl-CoA hydratase/isomerase family protein [Blastococcus sp. TF02A-26]RBY84380.1 enoyl-CoA hydratase/isomerase family protein [Blastococcus sp. TF02A-26]
MDTVPPGYTTLAVERRGPVGWLVFDRPRVGNAMDPVMMAELPAAWRELDADAGVRCIVVTGRGRAFQTGLDVVALAQDRDGLREQSRRTKNADLALTGWHLGVETPVVVAVNGVCAGGGLHFVVDADVAIASTAASFTDPHVSVGQASNWEAVGLVHRVPAQVAARLALLGAHERMDAESARRWGLVSEVVAPEELETAAQTLAERIAEADPAATRARKRAMWRGEELGLTAARHDVRTTPEAAP